MHLKVRIVFREATTVQRTLRGPREFTRRLVQRNLLSHERADFELDLANRLDSSQRIHAVVALQGVILELLECLLLLFCHLDEVR